MTQPFERIELDFEQFRRAVEDCRADCSFRPEHWKNVYDAMYRLSQRYDHEKERLTSTQRAPLEEAFDDVFIKSMKGIRHVGAHVKREKPFKIWTPENVSFIYGSSANSMFAGSVVTVDDVNGEPQLIDHLQWFDEALNRIGNALDRARKRD
ncbi:MAG: hypothetical protein P8Y53_11570 [Pseudolabrys sp.]